MIVKCIKLREENPILEQSRWNNVEGHLTLSKSYVVLALQEWLGVPCAFICDDISEDLPSKFPYYIPMCYFEIVDNSPSQYWIKKNNIIGFKELVEEEYFYYNLSEDRQREQEIYLHYRQLMYAEAGIEAI